MFNSVPKFRVQLRKIHTNSTIKNRQVVNSAWVFDDSGYIPLFFMIDESKLSEEKYMKLVSNVNSEFVNSNVVSIVFEDDILSNDIIRELCDTIKLFVMLKFVFSVPSWSLRTISFKNTPYKFSKLLLSDMNHPIIELTRRDITDVDCEPQIIDENGGKIIVSGKLKLKYLNGESGTVNFLFNENRNILLIDDKDLSHYVEVVKNPLTFYKKFLENGIIYYEHKITNYLDDEHKTFTILFKVNDIIERSKVMSLLFKDDILNKIYKKNIKIKTISENETSFVVNNSIVINKRVIFNLNPNLYRILLKLAEND